MFGIKIPTKRTNRAVALISADEVGATYSQSISGRDRKRNR
jgi:hypothetical protein